MSEVTFFSHDAPELSVRLALVREGWMSSVVAGPILLIDDELTGSEVTSHFSATHMQTQELVVPEGLISTFENDSFGSVFSVESFTDCSSEELKAMCAGIARVLRPNAPYLFFVRQAEDVALFDELDKAGLRPFIHALSKDAAGHFIMRDNS